MQPIKLIVTLVWALLLVATVAGHAAEWSRYENARFGYWIDVPPDFSRIEEAANGDGGISRSAAGRSELRVWGSHITEGDLLSEVAWRIDQDRADGWRVTYDKRTPKWASWSASNGSRIVYERAIYLCDGQAAYFRLEYDRSEIATFDAAISRLVKSLRADGRCK